MQKEIQSYNQNNDLNDIDENQNFDENLNDINDNKNNNNLQCDFCGHSDENLDEDSLALHLYKQCPWVIIN